MIKVILTDIEGTTSEVAFVHEVMFRYAADHLPYFLQTHHNNNTVQALVQEALQTAINEHITGFNTPADLFIYWIEQDRKHPALKQLQSLIWAKGYEDGTLISHVYPDVPPVLDRWFNTGYKLGVYSSGAVDAQKLFFKHTKFGDLNRYFSCYFDTRTGQKKESASYFAIAQALSVEPNAILFLSDVPAELYAAQIADFQVRHIVREGTAPSPDFQSITSFEAVQF